MIIENSVIKLDYNPAKDILFIEWPDFTDYTLSVAKHTLDFVVDTVRLYDVKYLLTDTRRGVVEISDQQYRELAFKFASDLVKTRIKKLARVVTEATLREQPVKELSQKAQLTIPIQNFDNIEDALSWLESE